LGVFKNLKQNASLLKERTGFVLNVTRVAVRHPGKVRDPEVPPEILSTDWMTVVSADDVDVVVELIGGTTEAFDLVSQALRAKKPVVTGNKALLAERGQELFKLAEENKVPIYFEAAVAGGIPIIQALQ